MGYAPVEASIKLAADEIIENYRKGNKTLVYYAKKVSNDWGIRLGTLLSECGKRNLGLRRKKNSDPNQMRLPL